jgi:hypothetical protein
MPLRIYNGYAFFPQPDGTVGRHQAGRYLVLDGHLHILEDYYGLLADALPEGPMDPPRYERLASLETGKPLQVIPEDSEPATQVRVAMDADGGHALWTKVARRAVIECPGGEPIVIRTGEGAPALDEVIAAADCRTWGLLPIDQTASEKLLGGRFPALSARLFSNDSDQGRPAVLAVGAGMEETFRLGVMAGLDEIVVGWIGGESLTRLCSPVPLVRKKVESGPDVAEVLRRLDQRIGQATEGSSEIDGWLSFPQRSCSFSFGPNRRPLPIGALRLLWSAGWPFSQRCPDCGGKARTIGFAGGLSTGGCSLICSECSARWFHRVGGLTTISDLVNGAALGKTEFRTAGAAFGGVVASKGEALLELLGLGPHE